MMKNTQIYLIYTPRTQVFSKLHRMRCIRGAPHRSKIHREAQKTPKIHSTAVGFQTPPRM